MLEVELDLITNIELFNPWYRTTFRLIGDQILIVIQIELSPSSFSSTVYKLSQMLSSSGDKWFTTNRNTQLLPY